MYDSIPATSPRLRLLATLGTMAGLLAPGVLSAQVLKQNPTMIRKVSGPSEKLEITTNTSRILTLDTRIPRVQVNNPELLSVTPLSATQIQVSAKKAGVTAVNLWDEEGEIHTVDVYIYGDVRELEHALKTQFPNSSVRVYRYSNSLVLTGFIDRPDYVTPIVELAQDYSPKIINNMNVGGVQQILLKVKVFEISRTKARKLGMDFSQLSSSGAFFSHGVTGLLANTTNGGVGALQTVADTAGQTVEFGLVSGNNIFYGWLDALQEHKAAKILAEPNIVAVSGRPALFNEGGEIPILIPQSLGTSSIEFKKFGTQVDFLPIVLGNGNIRLEVRPRISELDRSNGIVLQNVQIPALTVREVDTAVEMKAGQTFALAGLIQRRTETVNRGLPILASMPGIGVPFRRTEEVVNEVELLIMVTPEFVDAMNPDEVPACYPGAGTMSPTDKELYWEGQIEVPNMCSPCGGYPCVPTHGHEPCCPNGCLGSGKCGDGSCGSGFDGPQQGGYYQSGQSYMQAPQPYVEQVPNGYAPLDLPGVEPVPTEASPAHQHGELLMPPMPENYQGAAQKSRASGPAIGRQSRATAQRRAPAPRYAASRNPQYRRQASKPFRPQTPVKPSRDSGSGAALIGPVGYDVE